MLDFSKSYGVIYGHEWAKYEQGGTLYNAQGQSYDEQSTDREEISEYRPSKATLTENAREWLARQLKEGPMQRDELFKASEQAGYDWANIKDAAQELKVVAYKIREISYWRLNLEA